MHRKQSLHSDEHNIILWGEGMLIFVSRSP